MIRRVASLAVGIALGVATVVHAQTPAAPAAQPESAERAAFRPADISFSGKLYSPLKLSVFLPYSAKILSLAGQIGHKAKRGDVLATYEIPIDTRMDERSKLSPAGIKEIEDRKSVV